MECQQLDGDNVFYALSRLRSTRVNYKLQAHATCNPDPDSFLMKFVESSLDEHLVPIRKEKYEKRYFVRDGQNLQFFDSLAQAQSIYGGSGTSPVKDYLYVPGSILDNPVGLAQNEGYIATLKALPPVECRRLLHGAWVREQKAGYFKREWIKFESYPSTQAKKRARCWDLAFSEASEARPRVDATAGVLMSKDQFSTYTVEDSITLRERVGAVERAIFETAERDGRDVMIGLPKDPGATAGAYCQDLARRLSEKGFTVKLIRPERGKLQRFLPFASVAEAGFVRVVNGSWTENYINELEQTEFTNKTHDDQADATSDCFWLLNQGIQIPLMSIPNIQVSASPPSFHQSYSQSQGSGGNFTIPTFNIK